VLVEALLAAVLPAGLQAAEPTATTTVVYEAACGKEPDAVGSLGFTNSGLGHARFTPDVPSRLRTGDDSTTADGRYYFRPFTSRELDAACAFRLEVRVRVLSAAGSWASTCVQMSLEDRRLGIGFDLHAAGPLDDEILFLDLGAGGPGDVLARCRLPADAMRSYVLRVERGDPGPADDRVDLETEDWPDGPASVRLGDLKPCASRSYYGLLFGHPVGAGTGEAEWERVALEVSRMSLPPIPVPIARHRQLFLDDRLVESMAGLVRVQGSPVKSPLNPVLRREHAWEAARCELYGSVVWDPPRRLLQLFYSAMSRPYEIRLAYAESDDLGQHWRKPLLGLLDFEGNPSNIVYPGRYVPHGPSVLRDERDPDPGRRYKLFTADYPIPLTEEAQTRGRAGIDVAFSPDGIRWTPSPRNPVLPEVISDTGQCVLWDEDLGRYVAFVRLWVGGQRCVGRTESPDFEAWSPPEVVYLPTPADREQGRQFYSLSATRYEGLYVGLVWVFPAVSASADWAADTPTTWPELVSSRDGFAWQRAFPGTPFLPNGDPGSFDRRQIRLASSFVVAEDTVLLLYAGSPHPHVKEHNFDIGLAALRRDGFVALRADEGEGVLVTRPLRLGAGVLRLNAQTDPGGYVKAEVCDLAGTPLAGLDAARCDGFGGDATDAVLSWAGASLPGTAPPEGLRLRFLLRQARLYSFWLQGRP
jgi:hypothetical protein